MLLTWSYYLALYAYAVPATFELSSISFLTFLKLKYDKEAKMMLQNSTAPTETDPEGHTNQADIEMGDVRH